MVVIGTDRPSRQVASDADRLGGAKVLIEGKDFLDPSNSLRQRFGDRSTVLVRPDRVVMSHD